MDGVLIRRSLRLAAAVAALAVGANVAAAQSAVFTGTVTTDGRPLGGASVGIPEIGAGTITGADGKYSFTVDVSRYNGRAVNLVVRFIGYKPKRLPITLAAGRVEKDYALERDILNLDQVVVTGVNAETSQKKTAFAVAVVDNTAIKEVPAISPVGSLAGRVAGASVATVSGSPGSEPAIRLRAATSLTGNGSPLIIVDGTITRLGLADINSQDIDRVEVIKGAAASSLYGSDAANGVIQIFTKRGANLAEGQVNFTFRNEYGQSVPAEEGRPQHVDGLPAGPDQHDRHLGGLQARRERPAHLRGGRHLGQSVPAGLRRAGCGVQAGRDDEQLHLARPARGCDELQRVGPEHPGDGCR